MIERATERQVDRALTIGGVGRTETGELSPVTKGIYAGQYRRAVAWKLAELHSSDRTFTPEQVAQYALWLVEQGYARSTAGLAVRAIRWDHRVEGKPVPDGLPAYVLLGGDSTADHEAVNDLDSPASRDPTELLTAFASACRLGEPIGARDMCLVTLLYATGVSLDRLVALNIEDIQAEGTVLYGVPVDDIRHVMLRHADPAEHDATICPACAVGRWLDELTAQGAYTGPLLRSVDKAGNIAGTSGGKAGGSTADGRLRARGIPENILRPLARRAGLDDVARAPARALRLAGAAAAYARGELDLDQTARRAGYTPGSALLLKHLLELTAPQTREDS